jgi:hypothetical protein
MIADTRRIAAVHEAGHSVVARKLGLAGGRAMIGDDGSGRAEYAEDKSLCYALATLAARAAEYTVLGVIDADGCRGDDKSVAQQLAARGFAQGLRTAMFLHACKLVRRYKYSIEIVAQALLDRGELSGPEIDQLLLNEGSSEC